VGATRKFRGVSQGKQAVSRQLSAASQRSHTNHLADSMKPKKKKPSAVAGKVSFVFRGLSWSQAENG
jgi:hypothetical protein